MDMMGLNIKEELDEMDHFARIPKDLHLLILSRIIDLKFLCQCCLVSKNFAATIYHIKTVFLSLPSTEIPSSESFNDLNTLFPKISNSTSEEIIRFIQSSSLRELKFFSFLQKFRQIKSISLEFTCPESVCSASLLNIKVKFNSSGAIVSRLISLVPTTSCKDTEQGYDEYEDDALRTFDICEFSGTHLIFGCSVEWLIILSLLVKCLSSLECVIITSSKNKGILVLRDELLVAWRNNLIPGGILDHLTPGKRSVGWFLKLHLPMSGYVLNGVHFLLSAIDFYSLFHPSSGCDDDGDDDNDTIIWEYVGEKNVLDEALHEIIYY